MVKYNIVLSAATLAFLADAAPTEDLPHALQNRDHMDDVWHAGPRPAPSKCFDPSNATKEDLGPLGALLGDGPLQSGGNMDALTDARGKLAKLIDGKEYYSALGTTATGYWFEKNLTDDEKKKLSEKGPLPSMIYMQVGLNPERSGSRKMWYNQVIEELDVPNYGCDTSSTSLKYGGEYFGDGTWGNSNMYDILDAGLKSTGRYTKLEKDPNSFFNVNCDTKQDGKIKKRDCGPQPKPSDFASNESWDVIPTSNHTRRDKVPRVTNTGTMPPPGKCFTGTRGSDIGWLTSLIQSYCQEINNWQFHSLAKETATAMWSSEKLTLEQKIAYGSDKPPPQMVSFQTGINPKLKPGTGDRELQKASCIEDLTAVMNGCQTDATSQKFMGQSNYDGNLGTNLEFFHGKVHDVSEDFPDGSYYFAKKNFTVTIAANINGKWVDYDASGYIKDNPASQDPKLLPDPVPVAAPAI